MDDDTMLITQLDTACSDLRILLKTSAEMDLNLSKIDKKFDSMEESVDTISKRVAPLRSIAAARKALETRLNRAIAPALALVDNFKLCESLQDKSLKLSSELASKKVTYKKRIKLLMTYVKTVEQLTSVIGVISLEGEASILRLQEVVEILSRTKAADQYRTHRLRETLATLKALFESEVEGMKFDGLLDEALMVLQDEFEGMLERLRHPEGEMVEVYELGNEAEIQVLRSIAETLAENDCLDICVDIFVKTRYRRAAKALMSLNPDYLKTYNPEEIDEMEWSTLETAITLWIEHFEVAVRTVFVAEKRLCDRVLSSTMDVSIWTACFVKIADKIMAVFFRFGEGVARSNKEPQKLFKLLDMFESFQKLRPEFSDIFEGDAGEDICTRYRELEKLLIHASSKVFWEFGLQIEGNADGLNPPQDGSVSKMVRYAINYLKYLTTEIYKNSMTKVLETEQIWKMGNFFKPDPDQDLLKDAIFNILEALQRYVEMKKTRYRDSVLPHIFGMNTYWYIYMRSRNTEVGKLLGEQWMKKTFKVVAEESAYLYQTQAWGPLVQLLEKEDSKKLSREALVRKKMEGFMKMFKELAQAHKVSYSIPDFDLREQIREATMKFVVPVYSEFVELNSGVMKGKSYMSQEAMQEAINRVFEGGEGMIGRAVSGKSSYRKDGLVDWNNGASGEGSSHMKVIRRFRSNVSDV
ncbi:unnamed protein product [Rhodiola kirilowii]